MKKNAIQSEAYVSLARNYSIVLLVALAFGVDKSYLYWSSNRVLTQAREALAANFIASFAKGSGLLTSTSAVVPFDDSFLDKAIRHWTSGTPIRSSWSLTTANNGFFSTDYLAQLGQVRIEKPARVGIYASKEDMRPIWTAKVSDVATNAEPFAQCLIGIYQDVYNGQMPTNPAPAEVYSKIQYNIFSSRGTDIPGLDLKLSLRLAPWALSLLAMGLLVQIQNLLLRIQSDERRGIAEPWLMLDGEHGIERFFALSWLWTVALAPLISAACLAGIMWSDWRADGVKLSSASAIRTIAFAAIVFAGLRIAWTVARRAMEVRRDRLRLPDEAPSSPCVLQQ